MRNYAPVADELSLKEQSSRSMHEKSFRNDDVQDCERFEGSQQPSQQGMEISLEYADEIKYGRWHAFVAKCLTLRSIPRRRRIIIGLCILFGIIFIASVSASAGKRDLTLESSEARDRIGYNNGSSRFQSGGRGDGGGAGNNDVQRLEYQFVDAQTNNFFLGENARIPPFSDLHPVEDLDRYDYDRPDTSTPSGRLDRLTESRDRGIPTNAWYQNMLRLDEDQEPTLDHRVYTIPYVIDAAGDFSGVRAHATRLETTNIQVGLQIDEPWGLTLGAMPDMSNTGMELEKGYSVVEATDLGFTLQWGSFMKTTLVRGSPYVTMIYDMSDDAISEGILPTMHWLLDTKELPLIDGSWSVDCSSEPLFTVQRDIELVFFNSNQRWMLFFSRPVQIRCENDRGRPTIFQVAEEQSDSEDPLIIRGALVVSSSSDADDEEAFSMNYADQLRASADVYPGESTSVIHAFSDENDMARITFDWNAHSMRGLNPKSISRRNGTEMIMFALPHHREILNGKVSPTLCTTSMLGPACLVEGNVWNMYETLPDVDFRASRHPDPTYLPLLAESLLDDIRYRIPSNFRTGAADTYFSGKTTAKLARILLITEELKELCEAPPLEYEDACDIAELPSDDEIDQALNQLRDSVTVWVRTNSKAPFVYDRAWGGLVNCGCLYRGGECVNLFPDCPAFNDQGLNFGNAFYNDHHFHYGYHVYSAAALAHFDPSWALELYEDVALLIRDYANPSDEDTAFPVFRNKDWYRGHSWAGGITNPMFRNMMNQESASEAIMSYEAVALFGKTMALIFQADGDMQKAYVAGMMHKIGLTLTATEIRSTQKYWQVRQDVEESERIYPEGYAANVVGIMWEAFAQFTTWFGNAPYLIYGIQLLPLTPIAEARDDIDWANEIYGPLSQSCTALCVSEGWSIQVNAILATIGRVQEAVEGILRVPSTAYEYAGGNGHSKSNALWYISTRPGAGVPVAETRPGGGIPPIQIEPESEPISSDDETIDIEEDDDLNNTVGDDDQSENPDEDDFNSFFEDDIVEEIFGENEESGSNDNNIQFDETEVPTEVSFNNVVDIGIPIESDVSIIIENDDDEDKDSDNDDFNNDDFDENNFNDDDGDDDGDDDETTDEALNCFNPLCTYIILDNLADGYTCGARIQYLMDSMGSTEFDACQQVAATEFPDECGFCRPN